MTDPIDPASLITLCQGVHRGRLSLHSQRRRIEPLTDRGCDGPVAHGHRK